jgi:hypothetical protein
MFSPTSAAALALSTLHHFGADRDNRRPTSAMRGTRLFNNSNSGPGYYPSPSYHQPHPPPYQSYHPDHHSRYAGDHYDRWPERNPSESSSQPSPAPWGAPPYAPRYPPHSQESSYSMEVSFTLGLTCAWTVCPILVLVNQLFLTICVRVFLIAVYYFRVLQPAMDLHHLQWDHLHHSLESITRMISTTPLALMKICIIGMYVLLGLKEETVVRCSHLSLTIDRTVCSHVLHLLALLALLLPCRDPTAFILPLPQRTQTAKTPWLVWDHRLPW